MYKFFYNCIQHLIVSVYSRTAILGELAIANLKGEILYLKYNLSHITTFEGESENLGGNLIL